MRKQKMDDSQANNSKTVEDGAKVTAGVKFLHAKLDNCPFRGFSKMAHSFEVPSIPTAKIFITICYIW